MVNDSEKKSRANEATHKASYFYVALRFFYFFLNVKCPINKICFFQKRKPDLSITNPDVNINKINKKVF